MISPPKPSPPAPLLGREVLVDPYPVIGGAGVIAEGPYERKETLTAAALEEAGWLVDGRYRVSPRTSVTLGAPTRLDTSRYAVVVLLDSMSVDAAVRSEERRVGKEC